MILFKSSIIRDAKKSALKMRFDMHECDVHKIEKGKKK